MLRRLDMPAVESVDDLAQLEQITDLTKSSDLDDVLSIRRCIGDLWIAPIGPCRRNEGSAAVWQDDEGEQHAASHNSADHGQLLTLERVTLPDDRYIIWMIAEMGSVSPLPSTTSITNFCCGLSAST
jgi:hypothetical protein